MVMCYLCVEQIQNVLAWRCYGEPGCTLAHWLQETLDSNSSTMERPKCDGEEPRPASSSSPTYQEMKLEFSDGASLEDFYLITSALCKGGFNVSATVRATPTSAPSPSDTAEPSTYSIKDGQSIAWLVYWAVVGRCSKGTTQSSRTRER